MQNMPMNAEYTVLQITSAVCRRNYKWREKRACYDDIGVVYGRLYEAQTINIPFSAAEIEANVCVIALVDVISKQLREEI